MKSILLIGLGRFGKHIAMKLRELNHQVMAVDHKDLLYQLLLVVNSHDLVVQLPELHGDVFSETSQADQQNGFHSLTSLTHGDLLQGKLGEGVFICGQCGEDQC